MGAKIIGNVEVRELAVRHAWQFTSPRHTDDRGVLVEAFKSDAVTQAVGHTLQVAQANCSVSRYGVLRGIHGAAVPPGQAKYVSCLRGAVLDVVVDVRTGSPTFGCHDTIRLDDTDRQAVYVAEGLGHGFLALTDGAVVHYLSSAPYTPQLEFAIDPFDDELAIRWPREVEPALSPRDAAAPGLREARDAGLLPSYDQCLAHYDRLSDQ
ncbi:MAG: dTDP-4-dehydrorhamnose 3,5-epimerase family protein [Carbonactinosporaceae bacterium]